MTTENNTPETNQAGNQAGAQHAADELMFDLSISGNYIRNAGRFKIIEDDGFETAVSTNLMLDQCTKIQLLREKTRPISNTTSVETGGRTIRYRGRTAQGKTEAGEPYTSMFGIFRNGEYIRVNAFGANEAVLHSVASNPEVKYINVMGTPMFSRADRRAAYQAANVAVQAQLQGQKSIKVERLEVVYQDGKKELLIDLPGNCERI